MICAVTCSCLNHNLVINQNSQVEAIVMVLPLVKRASKLAFQWHEDCFLLPEGAISLAHHTGGFNQAFRYGERTYGLQYHCELTEDLLDLWLHEPALKKEFIDTYGLDQYCRTEREAVELFPTYAQHATMMLKNFFRLSEVI